MERIQIIVADTSHCTLLSNLGTKTFTEAFAEFNNPDDFNEYLIKSFRQEQIEMEIKEPGSKFFIAYIDKEPVGYARIRASREVEGKFPGKKTIELQRIYALQNFIGKGIGKALLNYCITFAQKQSIDLMWLGVWDRNHHAIEFYKQFGFEPFGSHVFMLGNDAQTDILMKKNITP